MSFMESIVISVFSMSLVFVVLFSLYAIVSAVPYVLNMMQKKNNRSIKTQVNYTK